METSPRLKIKTPSGLFKLGETYCVGFNNTIYLHIGPDWGFNICFFIILSAANVFFMLIMSPKVDLYMQIIGFIIYFGCLLSYLFTALKNPGIILNPWELELEEGENKSSICKVCDVIIEPESEHCFDCQLCIRGYDHHCPLSGKCIGSGNIIPFYTFLTLILASFIYFGVWFFITSINRIPQSSPN